jgi:hypothetical protein
MGDWCASATEPVLVRVCSTTLVTPPPPPLQPVALPGLSFSPRSGADLDAGDFGALQLLPHHHLAFRELRPFGTTEAEREEASAEVRGALADGGRPHLSHAIRAQLRSVLTLSAPMRRDPRGLLFGTTNSTDSHDQNFSYHVGYAPGDPPLFVVAVGSAFGARSLLEIGVVLDDPVDVPALP